VFVLALPVIPRRLNPNVFKRALITRILIFHPRRGARLINR